MRLVQLEDTITSAAGAVNGRPLRLGGHRTDIQILLAPAALASFEVSNDGNTWATATDAQGVALASLAVAAGAKTVQQRAEWGRFVVAIDAGQPRTFKAVAAVTVEER